MSEPARSASAAVVPEVEATPAEAAPHGLRRVWHVLWVRGLGRLLALLLVAPIKLYQVAISPALPATCKYHPSCSRYAERALLDHGPVSYTHLTLPTKRIV